ncbi:MAG: GNAT family N-acetyltransferase [Oscillospiraceae bacterium]
MKNQITIREAVTENDAAAFWEQLHAYHKRDIFTDSDKEELEYFLGQAYRDHMMKINGRPQDRCFFLFFHRGGQDIGFAMPVIFTTEDGKCFIMEFCVYPEFRGSGTGKACAAALLDWAKNTARVMRSRTMAATSGGAAFGNRWVLSRTARTNGANR